MRLANKGKGASILYSEVKTMLLDYDPFIFTDIQAKNSNMLKNNTGFRENILFYNLIIPMCRKIYGDFSELYFDENYVVGRIYKIIALASRDSKNYVKNTYQLETKFKSKVDGFIYAVNYECNILYNYNPNLYQEYVNIYQKTLQEYSQQSMYNSNINDCDDCDEGEEIFL